jgi:methylated-DNA-[protein]-cysteine S-methyltransferase
MEGQKYYAATLNADSEEGELPVFGTARAWLSLYFSGKTPDRAMPPLAPKGSAFRQAVWALLREIPRGELITYGDIARQLSERTGNPVSARAVGGAVGHNPISIMIPCHRVVGVGGNPTGYAGGVDKKLWLLRLEGATANAVPLPRPGRAVFPPINRTAP